MKHYIDNIATSAGTVVDGMIEIDFRRHAAERSTGYPGGYEITHLSVLWVEVADENDDVTRIEDVSEDLAEEILSQVNMGDVIDE